MKHAKKKKSLLPVAVVAAVAVLVVIGVGVWFFSGSGAGTTERGTNQLQAQEDKTEGNSKDYVVQTKYCDLHVPDEWVECLRVEILEDNGYEVAFYGTVSDRDEVWLYSYWFGSAPASAFPVGKIMTEGGDVVDVALEISDFMPDESWTDGEADELFGAQESMNYVLEVMKGEASFVWS